MSASTFPRTQLTLLRVGYCRHPECVAVRGGAWRVTQFPALVGLIRHPGAGVLLFDTGYAEHFERATARLPERLYRWTTPVTLPAAECLQVQLARQGIALHEVRAVFASHLHADHIAGLRDLPGAAIWCSDDAVRHAHALGRLGRLRKATLLSLLPDDFAQRHRAIEALRPTSLPGAWRALGPGYDLIGDGSLWALPLPGHARGHMGLLLRHTDDRQYLLAGDATWGIDAAGAPLAPAWPTRLLADDWGVQRRTLNALAALLRDAGEDCSVLPAHCARTYAGLPAAMRGTP